jgi:hypothetical protein
VSEEKKPLQSAGALRNGGDHKPRHGRTLLLLLVAAALCAALFLAVRVSPAPETEEPSAQTVLIARDKTLLNSITIQMSGADSFTLINQNDYDLSDTNDVLGKEYVVEGDPDFAVSTAQVLPMERYAADLTAEDVADRSPKDLEAFGLIDPRLTVVIGYRDGTRETLHFGGSVPTGIGVYLQREGDPAVYVIAEWIFEAFNRRLKGLAQTEQERSALKAAEEANWGERSEASDMPDTAKPNAPGGADNTDAPDVTARPG